jgi:hypothetical protein
VYKQIKHTEHLLNSMKEFPGHIYFKKSNSHNLTSVSFVPPYSFGVLYRTNEYGSLHCIITLSYVTLHPWVKVRVFNYHTMKDYPLLNYAPRDKDVCGSGGYSSTRS